MFFLGSRLVFIVFHGFWWVYSFSCFQVGFHGSRSVFMVFHSSRLVFMVPGGFSWYFVVPGWFFMVPGECLWFFMVTGLIYMVPAGFFIVPVGFL